jgi:3-ketosteroid 9alpha-monooxygenase subunit B
MTQEGNADQLGTPPNEVVVTIDGATHHLKYHPWETLLDTMRRGGLSPPFSCAQGACGTCMVRRIKGEVLLLANFVLTQNDLADGYTLACQGVPAETICEIAVEG